MILRRRGWNFSKRGLSTVALVATVLASVLAAEEQPSAIKLKVAAVQFRSAFDIGDNCKRMIDLLSQLASQHVQVAVFPECALTGYYLGPTMPVPEKEIAAAEERLRETCRDKKIAVVFGSVYKVNGHAYDAAVVFNSQGELVERYGKVYLAGEKWAIPGNHIAYFELDGVPSTVTICHDNRYPELMRLPAIEGALIDYHISAAFPLKDEFKIAPHRAQMMARAVENGIFVVMANVPANQDLSGSHGGSRIIASDGNIIKEASIFGEDILISTLTVKLGKPAWPQNSLKGPLADWWRSGVDWMMQNRHRPLD